MQALPPAVLPSAAQEGRASEKQHRQSGPRNAAEPAPAVHVEQTVWLGASGGKHLVDVHRMVHGACRLERGMLPDLRGKIQIEIPLSGPGLLLFPVRLSVD